MGHEFFHRDLKVNGWLVVISHELEFKVERVWDLLSLWQGKLIRLLRLLDRLHLGDTVSDSTDCNIFKECVWCSVGVDTHHFNSLTVLGESHIDASLHLPRWDLVAKLLHQELHDVIA